MEEKKQEERVFDHQYDFDGRPSVGSFEDPLLMRLMAEHGKPRFDLFPGLKVKRSTEE